MFLKVLLLGQPIQSVYDKKIKKKLINDCCFEEYDCQVQKGQGAWSDVVCYWHCTVS